MQCGPKKDATPLWTIQRALQVGAKWLQADEKHKAMPCQNERRKSGKQGS